MGTYGLREDLMPLSAVPDESHQHQTGIGTQKSSVWKDLGNLQKTLAPVTSADLFKSDAALGKPPSTLGIDRFLSQEAKIRQPSSLKASAAELGSDIISLSTGRPSPDTYPFERMDFAFVDRAPTGGTKTRSTSVARCHGSTAAPLCASVVREDPESSIDLAIALSYGYSLGFEQLIQFLTTHVSHVHTPPYSDWELCLTIGTTSALELALRNFANPGDFVLVEEYTYSGMIEAARPLGLHLVPIAMDAHGLCPDSLEKTLSTWELRHTGQPKPKLLYTIPTGQNPTGVTQPLSRRQEVLSVADDHDLLIIEDDPYYYLQFPKAESQSLNLRIPSYLSISRAGRILRLDSTSKILAPGLRLGWLTAPRRLVETFKAAHDLGVVHPSGPSQLIAFKLLSEAWGHADFDQWLRHLADSYRQKANVLLGAMERFLGNGQLRKICDWIDVEAGMFVWLKIDCSQLPTLSDGGENLAQSSLVDIEDKIYIEALAAGVLCCKGSFFRPPAVPSSVVVEDERPLEQNNRAVFFRLTFASVDEADLIKGVGNSYSLADSTLQKRNDGIPEWSLRITPDSKTISQQDTLATAAAHGKTKAASMLLWVKN